MHHQLLHYQFIIIWLIIPLFIDCVPIDNTNNNQTQQEQHSEDKRTNPVPDQPANNYNPDRNGQIKTDETLNLSPPPSSSPARILIPTHHHNNPVNSNNNQRQSRCLVEAILYSRSLKDDGHGHSKPVTFKSKSVRADSSDDDEDGVIKTRIQRSRNGRSLAYLTFGQPPSHAGNLAFVAFEPDASGKVIFPAGPFAQYRPTLFTINGFKVWGQGTESKFGPILEYFVQRVQSYYSIYKYEDLSRPGFDYIKPNPKPGDNADYIGAIQADVALPQMVLN